jgi:predicted deacylase
VLNVLRHLGMLPGVPEPPEMRLRLEETRWVRARVGGILDLQVELGQPLRRGQTISVTTNPFGRGRSQLEAPFGGLALGLTQLPLVHPGDPVCHIAQLEGPVLDAWSLSWERGRIRL